MSVIDTRTHRELWNVLNRGGVIGGSSAGATIQGSYLVRGAPEGNLALAQAVVYLCAAPKSNALYTAYSAVQQDVEQTSADPVPLHLRNAPTGLMKGLGYSRGYEYAHDLDEKVADMPCLPESLAGRVYYHPTSEGIEKRIRERLEEIKRLKRTASDRTKRES